MSEEKKLTDEEIVKALEICAKEKHCGLCEVRHFCEKIKLGSVGLIHRLQDENKRLKTFIDFKTANVMCEKCKEQAVKEKIRDVIKIIKRNGILEYGGYVIYDSKIELIAKKYGVEV